MAKITKRQVNKAIKELEKIEKQMSDISDILAALKSGHYGIDKGIRKLYNNSMAFQNDVEGVAQIAKDMLTRI